MNLSFEFIPGLYAYLSVVLGLIKENQWNTGKCLVNTVIQFNTLVISSSEPLNTHNGRIVFSIGW
jgi:hypothetical protein